MAGRDSRRRISSSYMAARSEAGKPPIRKGHIHHAAHLPNPWAALAIQGCASHESRSRPEPTPPSPYAIEVKIGDVMHESKDIQEPHDYTNDHESVQDRLDGARHRNEPVDEPEKNPHHDQGNYDLN
jgi:hypothetical protein